MPGLSSEVRRFVRTQQNGVLSTISQRLQGYPFGSVTPFMSDSAGRPVILISDLAEHTKNIAADPRVSLIVQPFSTDMQATARVTLIGRAERLAGKEALGPRYLHRFPQAADFFAMHDFQFYRLEPLRIRYIGSFGKIHWLEPEAYLCMPGSLSEAEAGILEHMNRDHGESLQACCRHFLSIVAREVEMIGIDPDGFDLRTDGQVRRIEFTQPVLDAASARAALVGLAQQCHA